MVVVTVAVPADSARTKPWASTFTRGPEDVKAASAVSSSRVSSLRVPETVSAWVAPAGSVSWAGLRSRRVSVAEGTVTRAAARSPFSVATTCVAPAAVARTSVPWIATTPAGSAES